MISITMLSLVCYNTLTMFITNTIIIIIIMIIVTHIIISTIIFIIIISSSSSLITITPGRAAWRQWGRCSSRLG